MEESPLRRSSFVVVLPALAVLFTVTLHACGGTIGAGDLLGGGRPTTTAERSSDPVSVSRLPNASAPATAYATQPPPAESEEPVEPPPSLDFEEGGALEAFLPHELRGVALLRFSVAGDAFQTDESTRALLRRLQASPDDASAAFAVDPSGRLSGQIVALRVAGADSERLRDEYRTAVETLAGNPMREVRIAGKDVLTGINPEDPQSAVYFYAHGDVLFFVFTPDPSLAAEALALLP